MIKKIIVIIITTFALVSNLHAGSDGELLLKKNEPSDIKDCSKTLFYKFRNKYKYFFFSPYFFFSKNHGIVNSYSLGCICNSNPVKGIFKPPHIII